MVQKAISRRQYLTWGMAAVAGLSLSACGRQSAGPSALATQAAAAEHPLAALQVQDLQGQPVASPWWPKQRPVMLNFWATWCPPCLRELPSLDASYRALAQPQFDFFALAVDDLLAVQRYWPQQGLRLPVLVASSGALALSRRLGNGRAALPFSVLLAADGAILHSHTGALVADAALVWMQQAQKSSAEMMKI